MIKVGDRVILGKNTPDPSGTSNWCGQMDPYVGQMATVVFMYECKACTHCGWIATVDRDGGQWPWRVADMQPALPDLGLSWSNSPPPVVSKQDGAFCCKCRNFVQYVEPSDSFVCYSCKH